MLPVAVAGILVAAAIGIFIFFAANGSTNAKAGVECQSGEQLAVHYHAELAIYYQGTPVPVPAYVGFGQSCLYWLHTHDQTGTIHIEAPASAASRTFTLGDFFDVWGQPLSSTQVATLTVPSGAKLQVWTQKATDPSPVLWTGNPRSVPLLAHETITVEVTPPTVTPKPYVFPAGV